jgi:hypothetical protein
VVAPAHLVQWAIGLLAAVVQLNGIAVGSDRRLASRAWRILYLIVGKLVAPS